MRIVYRLLSVCFVVVSMNACVDPSEGCTDPFSSNYQLDADKSCEDCCTYPSFSLSTQYLYGEENIDSSLYYQNTASSYFKLRSFYLVLSEFLLIGDLSNYEILSKLENKATKDDLVGIRFKASSNSPGKISIEDSIRSIEFKMGMPQELDDPINADLDYGVLEFLQDSMYFDSSENLFYKLIIGVEVDSMNKQEKIIFLDDLDMQYNSNVVTGTTRGNSMNIQLIIDFERLFNGLEFQGSNVETAAKEILRNNLGAAIEVN